MAVFFSEVCKTVTDERVEKFNPYHDSQGRFSTAGGAVSFTIRTKNPAKQNLADRGITREKERTKNWKGDGIKKPPKKKIQEKNRSALKENGEPRAQVKGKNIKGLDVVKYSTYKSGNPKGWADQVAEAQGYKAKPAVVSKKEFDDAVKRTGTVCYRTFNNGTDVVTGKHMTAKQFAEKLMYDEPENIALNGGGGQSFGAGIYFAAAGRESNGGMPDGTSARNESTMYGNNSSSAVIAMTPSPTAKIADYTEIRSRLMKEPMEVFVIYGDVGAYAAACGYDGVRKNFEDGVDYMMILNRSAMIICNEIRDVDGNRME